jgi:hypothetical protein
LELKYDACVPTKFVNCESPLITALRIAAYEAGDLFAPRLGHAWASRFTTLKWHREFFRYQYLAYIAAVRFQRAALSLVVASVGSFRARRARTLNKVEIQMSSADKIADSPRGLSSQFTLSFADRTARFRRVEADESHVWLFVEDSNCVAVDYTHVT